jgi:hypothetical protein
VSISTASVHYLAHILVLPNCVYIGSDGVRLTSQNCGLYGPIVHPQVICDVDHGMIILTEANSQLVYQSALTAPSTGWFPFSRDISGSHQ